MPMKENNKARQIKQSVRERLFTLSGNQCTHPECNRSLYIESGTMRVGIICHVEAVSKGGPRYNPDMTDDERRHYDNLILLCDDHHHVIDNKENEGKYSVKLLKRWKTEHYIQQMNSRLTKKPSLMMQAIKAIASINTEEELSRFKEDNIAFEIENKISYNSIKKNKSLIEEYCIFYAKINTIYDELESQGFFTKEKLLRNIRQIYLRTKGQFISENEDEIQSIQKHADEIYERVETQLFEQVKKLNENNDDDAFFAIPVIMVDAFMRCKIMEKPQR